MVWGWGMAPPTAIAPAGGKLAYSRREAAAALGVSPAHFDRHVRPFVRRAWVGAVPVYPAAELAAFIERSME